MTTRVYILTLLNPRQQDDGDDDTVVVNYHLRGTVLYRPLGWSLYLISSDENDDYSPVAKDKWVLVETDPSVLAQQLRDAIPANDDVLKSFAAYVDWGQRGPFAHLKRHALLYIPDRDGPIVVNEIDTVTGIKRCWGPGTFINEYAPPPLIKKISRKVH